MSKRAEAQVAWKAIEADAEVVSSDGESVGNVSRVVGDATADVFTGLAILVGSFGGERFVAAERVSGIWANRVELDLSASALEDLPKYEDTPVVRWRPGPLGGIFSRIFGRRR
ncbi:MAG: PRC-barrel domain-containing protein [Actinomycetota bacterium]|nr:PRC-barrel domain-containing protein [Actinomycetota bacterium]